MSLGTIGGAIQSRVRDNVIGPVQAEFAKYQIDKFAKGARLASGDDTCFVDG